MARTAATVAASGIARLWIHAYVSAALTEATRNDTPNTPTMDASCATGSTVAWL